MKTFLLVIFCAFELLAPGGAELGSCSNSNNTQCDVGTNVFCDTDDTCKCTANYKDNNANATSVTDCVAKECPTDTCGTNSYCTGTTASTGVCACKANFKVVGASCIQKKCTENKTTTCDAHSACVGEKCQCKANYDGEGANCTQKTCIGNATTTCNDNSVCVGEKCQCKVNYVGTGTECTKKTCTAAADCDASSACVGGKCQCMVNYYETGDTCTQTACTVKSQCADNSACSSSKCECAKGFKAEGSMCKSGAETLITTHRFLFALSGSVICFCNKMSFY